MDLLLDVNIIIDICANREPFSIEAMAAIEKCKCDSGQIWIYTGSVQTLQFNLSSEIRRIKGLSNISISSKQSYTLAKSLLTMFCQDKNWLSSLPSEGNVFESDDPEDEQLIRSLDRFSIGSIVLLTRDSRLLTIYPNLTISPLEYVINKKKPKSIPFIDLTTQQSAIRPQLERNIHKVLNHGQYIMGPEITELEERLCQYTGSTHCITVSSGTEALLISLMALDIKPGDEVITTPFTFVATAEVIALLGAVPVFIDIEPDTCNINASLIEPKITSKTKAIMPVSLYGQPADMDEINQIAAKHGNIPVIEDAAQSFGATYKNKKSCNLSTIGCTSFFPSKPLGCYGDGGAIFTNDDSIAQACREIRIHGQSKRYYHTRIGVGGRMDTLQAAIVLAKLSRFDYEVEKRLEIGNRYNQWMDEHGISRIQQRPDRSSVFAQYTIFTDDRTAIQEKLKLAGIPTAVHYPIPLNEQPAYTQFGNSKDTPVSSVLSKKVMSLPMSAENKNYERV